MPGQKRPDPKKNRPSGGCLLDRIGTLPIKPIFRVLSFKSDWLWHRQNQAQFTPKGLYITHLLWCALPPRYLNEIQRQLAPVSFRVAFEEARYFAIATDMLPVHQEYNVEESGSPCLDKYFESNVNAHGEDVHELEVRAEAPRYVLKQLSEGIKAKAQRVGGGLTGPPDDSVGLAAHVNEIANSFVDDAFPSASWEPHSARKRLHEICCGRRTQHICLGEVSLGLLRDSIATHERKSDESPWLYPPLSQASVARQFAMTLNKAMPLTFTLWQNSERGLVLRNASEAKQKHVDPHIKHGRLRAVAELQSSHGVSTGEHGTGLATRRSCPEKVTVGTELPQGLFPKEAAQ